MSISSALSVAASGMRVNQFQSDLIARNIANASTEGYSRKSPEIITGQGGGVGIAGVTRDVDQLLERLDRANISDVSRSATIADGLKTYTDFLGQPTDGTSPAEGISKLYNSLLTLSGNLTEPAAQMGVIDTAKALARQINDLGQTAASLKSEVELNIRYDVTDVNEALTRISQINGRLGQSGANGAEGADLLDEMARLLDRVSSYMDIQTTTYGDGQVNVFTTGGSELVNGRKVNALTYDPAAGTLMAGRAEITPNAAGVRGFGAGSLAGLFELKTDTIPTIQAQLDEFASLLVTRFAAADVSASADPNWQADPNAAPVVKGLFVDGGIGGVNGQVSGMALRLGVNAAYDKSQGGDASLLVTGLHPDSSVATGSLEIVRSMMAAFDSRPNGATAFGDNFSINDYAVTMVSRQQQMRVAAETSMEQASISGATISASRQNLAGVNIDDELQKLLVVEQSFAANAKVLTSLQIMLDTLMDAV